MINRNLFTRVIGWLVIVIGIGGVNLPSNGSTPGADQAFSSPLIVVDVIADPDCQPTSADAKSFREIVNDIFVGLRVGDRLRVHIPGRIGKPPVTAIDISRCANDGPALITTMWEQETSKRLGVKATDIFAVATGLFRADPQPNAHQMIAVLLSRKASVIELKQARDLALEMRDSRSLLVIVAGDRVVDELAAAAACGARIDPISSPRPTAWIAPLRPTAPAPTAQPEDPRIVNLQGVANAQAAVLAAQEIRQRELEQQLKNLEADGTASVGKVKQLSDELLHAHESAAQAQERADVAHRDIELLQRRLQNLDSSTPARSDTVPLFGRFLVTLNTEPANTAALPNLEPATAAVPSSIATSNDREITAGPSGDDGCEAAVTTSSASEAQRDLGDVAAQAMEVDASASAQPVFTGAGAASVENAGDNYAKNVAWPIFGGIVAMLAAAGVAALYLTRKPAAHTFTLLDESSKASHRIQMTAGERVDLNGAQPVKKARAGNGRAPFLTINRNGRLALHPANGFITKLNDRLVSSTETPVIKPGNVLEITANGHISRVVVGPVSAVKQNPKVPLNLSTPSMRPA